MTVANKITMVRIALVPVFVGFALAYGSGVREGEPWELYRWAALWVFGLAAASDGLDGWVARRFGQRTELGVVLDPLADKGLLLAGIGVFSLSPWAYGLPVWFGVLVVIRDFLVLAGVLGVFVLHGKVSLCPGPVGKVATALQMVMLLVLMLQPDWLGRGVPFSSVGAFAGVSWFEILLGVTAVLTLASGIGYIGEGLMQLHSGGIGRGFLCSPGKLHRGIRSG